MRTPDDLLERGKAYIEKALTGQPYRGAPAFDDVRAVGVAILQAIVDEMNAARKDAQVSASAPEVAPLPTLPTQEQTVTAGSETQSADTSVGGADTVVGADTLAGHESTAGSDTGA